MSSNWDHDFSGCEALPSVLYFTHLTDIAVSFPWGFGFLWSWTNYVKFKKNYNFFLWHEEQKKKLISTCQICLSSHFSVLAGSVALSQKVSTLSGRWSVSTARCHPSRTVCVKLEYFSFSKKSLKMFTIILKFKRNRNQVLAKNNHHFILVMLDLHYCL